MVAQRNRPRISQADIIQLGDWNKQVSLVSHLVNGEHEQALISAVFQNPDGYFSVSDTVQPSDFYSLMNGFVWKAFEDVLNASNQIDILTVKAALEKYPTCPLHDDFLLRHLTTLYGYAPNALNIEAYAQEVRDAALRVRVYKALDEMKSLVQPSIPPDALTDKLNELLFNATEQNTEADTGMAGMLARYWDRLERGIHGEKSRVVPTGIEALDNLLGGFSPGEVSVLAGADKMGKTTLLLSIIRYILKLGLSVYYFSLEMTQDEIMRILTTMETGISKRAQKMNQLSGQDWATFVKVAGEIRNWTLDVNDQYPALTPTQLRRVLRKQLSQHPVDLVVIDGLWLMQAEDTHLERPQAVSHITSQLSQIAKNEFKLPILITHQYKDNMSVKGSTPSLGWIAESISVRRNAQVLLGMHRPKHFDMESADDAVGLYVLGDRNGQGAQGEYVALGYDEQFATYKGANYVDLNQL